MSSETSRQLIWSVKQRRREGVLGRQVITRERKTRCVIISTVPSRVSLAWGPLEPSEPWSMTKLLQISDFPVLSLLHGLVPWYLHEQRSQDATTLCLSTLATKTLCLSTQPRYAYSYPTAPHGEISPRNVFICTHVIAALFTIFQLFLSFSSNRPLQGWTLVHSSNACLKNQKNFRLKNELLSDQSWQDQ